MTVNTSTTKKVHYLRPEFAVAILALVIALNSQSAALVNHYVLNGDVFESTYWMPQFNDSELFRNDLLTEYSKHFHSPWGFLLFYRGLSVLLDPLSISKILPLILFVISCLFIFRLVKHFTTNFTAFIAALLFMVTPVFLGDMVGGHPRAFAYPLLIPFVYYLMKQEYAKASLVMTIQSLFYPMIFLISALTYLLTFVTIRHYKIYFDRSISKASYFIMAVLVSGAVLSVKYVFLPQSSIGNIVSRNQMLNRPEFGEHGRVDVIHTLSLPKAIWGLSSEIATSVIKKYPTGLRRINKAVLNIQTVPVIIFSLVVSLLILMALEISRSRISIPKEFLYLFVSSAAMYMIADALLYKLYQPIRYIQYTIPLICVVVISVTVSHLIATVRSARVKAALSVLVILVIGLHFNVNKGIGLRDYGNQYLHQSGLSEPYFPIDKDLYVYLSGLPKDVIIVAQPYLADSIPTFARRKVLINFELSHPFYDKYWETIKERTVEFFKAYYAHDCSAIRRFAEKYDIQYFVVDKRHFDRAYLSEGKMYFEPFNAAVKNLVQGTNDYVLLHISDEDKLFKAGDIFVFDTKIMTGKCSLGLPTEGYGLDQQVTAAKNRS
jgi:hypothetical protein